MIETQWTKTEFQAYVLLFVAQSDFRIGHAEKRLITEKVDPDTYQHILEELQQDNDYQSLQKILSALKKYHYSENDIDSLFTDIKAVFWADGDFSRIEQNLFLGLKKLVRA